MPILKTILLGLFLSFFIMGKGYVDSNNLHNFYTLKFDKKSNSKAIETFLTNNDHESTSIKSKRKPRCIEVSFPSISNLLIRQEVVYDEFQILYFEHTNTSFLYCARCKRGPPQT